MRITTQMLNNTAVKTGININRTSLLDYVNNPSKASAFIDSLASGNYDAKNSESLLSTKNYDKLLEVSKKLEKLAGNLVSDDEKSVIGEALKNKDADALTNALDEFVKNCNETLEALNKTSSRVDSYYATTLKALHISSREQLSALGISINEKSGMLSFDDSKLEGVDIETLGGLVGELGDYADKVKFIASRCADNAETSINSVSNLYNSKAKETSAQANTASSRYSYKC